MQDTNNWANPASPVCRHIELQSSRCLEAYRANPLLVTEHANIERAVAQGGYGHRQLYELIQNGADALIGKHGGKIQVLLTERSLYCANEGEPLDIDGANALLGSHLSMKHGLEIGRFGLGFKSVLGITQEPQFYSRSGSFCFDEVISASKIREVIPSAERFPILRIARPIDALEASAEDPVLADLMTWATTVVKLPCNSPEAVSRLSKDISEFPGEFLLFSSHVGVLLLHDRTTGTLREVRLEYAGDSRLLMVDGKKSRWKLFSTNFRPPDQARRDAGELADREELPVMWAVPMEGRAAAGQFWAFFPTEYKTTLSGIVNAPWKTNEDRQNLLRGDFNSSILDCAANLVVDNLASLSDPEDPGAIVDVLPARKEDAHNWADESLNESVYARARTRPCIPDQEGNLAVPTTLGLPPAGLPRQALEIWASCPARPVDWCHPSLETRTRRLRVERLVLGGRRSASTVEEWLETLVKHPSPQSSSSAVRAGAAIALGNDPLKRLEVDRAKIVLTADGRLVPPDPQRVFLPSDYVSLTADLSFVHPDLATDKEAIAALAAFGIKPADVRRELENLISMSYETFRDVDWDRFWMLAELAGPAAPNLIRIAGDTHRIKARTLSGSFRPIKSTLLPGSIVPEDGSRDSTIAIDRSFHAGTLPLLMKLGAVESPQADLGSDNEEWYHEYRTQALGEYARHLSPTGSKPGFGKLTFNRGTCIGPLEPIYILSEEGCVAFTEAVLSSDDPKWVMLHETRPNNYPQVPCDPPSLWAARRKGRLNTSRGIEPLAECVGSDLSDWAEILPVAQCSSDIAERVALPQRFSDLSQNQWKAAFDSVQKCTDDSLLGRFYVAAATVRDDPPTFITCRVGNDHRQVRTLEVHAVSIRTNFRRLSRSGCLLFCLRHSTKLTC